MLPSSLSFCIIFLIPIPFHKHSYVAPSSHQSVKVTEMFRLQEYMFILGICAKHMNTIWPLTLYVCLYGPLQHFGPVQFMNHSTYVVSQDSSIIDKPQAGWPGFYSQEGQGISPSSLHIQHLWDPVDNRVLFMSKGDKKQEHEAHLPHVFYLSPNLLILDQYICLVMWCGHHDWKMIDVHRYGLYNIVYQCQKFQMCIGRNLKTNGMPCVVSIWWSVHKWLWSFCFLNL
jgi:hypothetical protein